ncbi:MAG: F0F1 ATP synthase subunit epsilon [Leptolyngbya sp. SIO3F4]|nr:F0F1 ATP synthase subunit epsilon [Leptolyngbya sp. SIO3F4]
MILEVLTPEKLLYRGEVQHVQMPGLDGSFGLLNNHAPMIATLKAGTVTVDQDTSASEAKTGEFVTSLAKNATFDFDIHGGVVEVNRNKVILLAD